jgi:hypothetical protein
VGHGVSDLPRGQGRAEGFVHTYKRDYVNVHELRDAETVLAQLGGWIEDCNRQARDSALCMRSTADYRAVTSASSGLTPHLSRELGSRSGLCHYRHRIHDQSGETPPKE